MRSLREQSTTTTAFAKPASNLLKLVNRRCRFRDAQVLPAYLDARLAELKWAVVIQELKVKGLGGAAAADKYEEKKKCGKRATVRRHRTRKTLSNRLWRKRVSAEHATAHERAQYDAQIVELNQRGRSHRRETAGDIHGAALALGTSISFRTLGRLRRCIQDWHDASPGPNGPYLGLSDASVPFDFDVHAIIACSDAPNSGRMLHEVFDDLRINKINLRKEFFRLPLQRIRDVVIEKGLETVFTMIAEAREYRETVALAKMSPQERERFHLPQAASQKTVAE